MISALAVFLSVLGREGSARASVDAARITMGKTTYPAKALIVDAITHWTIPEMSEPTRDRVFHEMVLEGGVTNRWSVGAGFQTGNAKRDSVAVDRILVESAYMLLRDPFQLTPGIEILPSVRGEPIEAEFGFQALKNLDDFMFLLPVEMELEKEAGEWELEGQVEPGVFYRFGLNGLAGLEGEYQSNGGISIDPILGGRVSKNIFLAIESQVGLNRQAPDLAIKFQLNLYFGPHRTPGLE